MKAMMMSVASATIKPALAAAIVATSFGCGSQGSPTEPSSFIQEPRPIAQPGQTVPASNGGVPGVYRFDVAMPHDGTATVTLQWPNGDFSLQLYVSTGACADTSGLVAGACNILGATRPGTRPGVVTSPVVSGEVVTVWVLNTDEQPQEFTVGVEINQHHRIHARGILATRVPTPRAAGRRKPHFFGQSRNSRKRPNGPALAADHGAARVDVGHRHPMFAAGGGGAGRGGDT